MALTYVIYQTTALLFLLFLCNAQQQVNPSILQDSRNLPQADGTFGFLYRTEDGISHGAVSDSSGSVHGRFTYSDPSGFKINYNYNTGSVRGSSGGNTKERNIAPSAASQPVYQNQQRESYNAKIEDSNTYSQPQFQARQKPNKKSKPQNVDYISYTN